MFSKTATDVSFSIFLILFLIHSAASQCQGGRSVGPVPSVTDDRRLDGTSNNKDHVFWGAAQEDVARDAPAMYADGIALPAGVCTPEQRKSGNCRYVDAIYGLGSNRPSPRKISNELFQQIESKISARRLSDFHPNWGQFLAHDTDSSGTLANREFADVFSDVWLPIEVPKGDIHFDRQNKGNVYLTFVRTTFNRCTGRSTNTSRQQVNKLTSYIDGSVVYGETEERNRALRQFKDGKMKVGLGELLPENTEALSNDNPVGRDAGLLLAAGDSRANEQPGLISMHTLFVREHNRLCDEYKNKNPQATDEQIFQYARRLVAAEIQAITFREYLPATLGGTQHIPAYQGYNKSINVGMSNMMSTAAFRFGHSQVNTLLWRFEEDGTMSHYGHLALRDAYFSPERVSREGGIEPLFRGAVRQAAQEVDLKMVDDMRNALFPSGRELGQDLASKNIQRGRDHGLPDYNSVRKALGLTGLSSFSEITKDSKTAEKMEEVYQDINNIDLWVGGLAEDHESGSELGETFRT
ncbi:peroxinectin A-like [Orbicella faveolata]|uniref:peroxinectin A-like n=1 Tax=Orbicella faveolata TaxID=48498 RepID=UPI0009E4A9FC|nr:peroxinectin A-like [Orbicella faveolata]